MRRTGVKVLIVLGIVSAVILFFALRDNKLPAEPGIDTYSEMVKYLTEDVPTVFYIYGDTIPFHEPHAESVKGRIDARRISTLSRENLMPDGSAEHYVLVIHDFYEHAPITKEDIELINELIETRQYTFYYIGHRYVSDFVENGLWGEKGVVESSSDASISVGFDERIRCFGTGPLRDDDFTGAGQSPYLVGESIVSSVVSYVKSCR
ncbi:MAG: hypothetical protein K6B39_03290 [Lachnospiraceae bacterium]|nr:hypothetical protein [Lachnospiraceae bacterium]